MSNFLKQLLSSTGKPYDQGRNEHGDMLRTFFATFMVSLLLASVQQVAADSGPTYVMITVDTETPGTHLGDFPLPDQLHASIDGKGVGIMRMIEIAEHFLFGSTGFTKPEVTDHLFKQCCPAFSADSFCFYQ